MNTFRKNQGGGREGDGSSGSPPYQGGARGGKAGTAATTFCFGVPKPDQRQFFGNADVKARYEEAIATQYNTSQVIGYAEEKLTRYNNATGGDSMLGNFTAEAMRFTQA